MTNEDKDYIEQMEVLKNTKLGSILKHFSYNLNIKVVDFVERKEKESEIKARKEEYNQKALELKEEALKTKPKKGNNLKNKKEVPLMPEFNSEPLMVREVYLSSLSMKYGYNNYIKWIASVIQTIIDLEIESCWGKVCLKR